MGHDGRAPLMYWVSIISTTWRCVGHSARCRLTHCQTSACWFCFVSRLSSSPVPCLVAAICRDSCTCKLHNGRPKLLLYPHDRPAYSNLNKRLQNWVSPYFCFLVFKTCSPSWMPFSMYHRCRFSRNGSRGSAIVSDYILCLYRLSMVFHDNYGMNS